MRSDRTPEVIYERNLQIAEKNLNRIARSIGAFLFPSRCVACGEEPVESFFRGGVCAICWGSLPHTKPESCEICGQEMGEVEPEEAAKKCGRCLLDAPSFRRLAAAAPYRGSARSILLAFKFRGADYLAPHLAKVLVSRLRWEEPVDEITAVPATPRSRRRQDHAAEILAAAVARELGVPFSARRLVKVRATRRQSALPASERPGNVRGAFRARAGAPERVLLVDDVATSGSTARECALALTRAGAGTVEVWCFARASRDDAMSAAFDVRGATFRPPPFPGLENSERRSRRDRLR